LGDVLGGAGIGAAIHTGFNQLGNALGASAAGRNYNPALNMGPMLGAVGGIGGFLLGGPFGAGIGAGILGGFGNMFSSTLRGLENFQVQQRLTGAMTGMTYSQMMGGIAPIMGLPDFFSPKDNHNVMGVGGGGFNNISPAAAMQALSMLAPSMSQGYGFREGVSSAAQGLISRFGSPLLPGPSGALNPAFAAATQALAGPLSNPFTSNDVLNAIKSGGGVSSSTMMAMYLTQGAAGTEAALAALGDRKNLSGFANMNYDFQKTDLWISTSNQASVIKSANAGIFALRGDRAGLFNALDEQATNYGDVAHFNYQQYNRINAQIPKSGPWSRSDQILMNAAGRYHAAAKQAQYLQEETIVGQYSNGPSYGWMNDTLRIQTAEQIIGMDPFNDYVPMSLRYKDIANLSSRRAQIEAQIAAAPAVDREAVRTRLMPEDMQLALGIAGEQRAIKMGDIGHIMDIGFGQPTGFQAWGIGRAISPAALQRYDEGVSQAFGGTGASVGHGTAESILQTLRSIDAKLSGGGTTSPFQLVSDRANRLIR
jgi:hypothetical protein